MVRLRQVLFGDIPVIFESKHPLFLEFYLRKLIQEYYRKIRKLANASTRTPKEVQTTKVPPWTLHSANDR